MAGADRIIALEEHFLIPSVRERYTGYHAIRAHQPVDKLLDLGALRLKEMEAAGIDLQVLSLVQPGAQAFDPATGADIARQSNDALYEAVRAHPDRFAGFAAIQTSDPKAAADELERTVTCYGFKGAMINGMTDDLFLDDKHFWPIFERAQALNVPLYLHPAIPHQKVIEAYYGGIMKGDYPVMMGAVWGFGVETATHAIRLILAGVFDAFPKLDIILGHLGEAIPFALWRLEWTIQHMTGRNGFADVFRDRFHITTSGNFSQAALACTIAEMGVDRVLFSVDWPYNSNVEGVKFVEAARLSIEERRKIFGGNAARLLRL
jgi:predicted TIM-barrel fold metal-dependent hydrolase